MLANPPPEIDYSTTWPTMAEWQRLQNRTATRREWQRYWRTYRLDDGPCVYKLLNCTAQAYCRGSLTDRGLVWGDGVFHGLSKDDRRRRLEDHRELLAPGLELEFGLRPLCA